MSNYIHCFVGDVINDPCANFNDGLAKPALKYGRGWMIKSHCCYVDVIMNERPNSYVSLAKLSRLLVKANGRKNDGG